jgi:DNA (cytosine-5)-methyltransferase 1
MRTVDMFSGLGGFSQGATEAGATVILAANHSPDAVHWHRVNHPDAVHVEQDLGEMDMRGLPEHDLLIASPCCQGFSPSGRPGQSTQHRIDRDRALARRQVARNTAWAVITACEVARPRLLVIENVQEFLDWTLFGTWKTALESLGYHLAEHRVNARDHGASQDRHRAIILASLDGAPGSLPAGSGGPHRSLEEDLLPDGAWGLLGAKTASIQARVGRARARAGDLERFVWANVDSARARDPRVDGWPTLTTKSLSQLHVVEGDRIRRIEARELARAMGLPDSYQIPVNRTVAGRLIGNMIPVPLARAAVEAVMTS